MKFEHELTLTGTEFRALTEFMTQCAKDNSNIVSRAFDRTFGYNPHMQVRISNTDLPTGLVKMCISPRPEGDAG